LGRDNLFGDLQTVMHDLLQLLRFLDYQK